MPEFEQRPNPEEVQKRLEKKLKEDRFKKVAERHYWTAKKQDKGSELLVKAAEKITKDRNKNRLHSNSETLSKNKPLNKNL